ncbi:hypothetical protein ACS0TY_004695 [Phlomoides rotata]
MPPAVNLQPLNFSKIQRLVLLVDLDPLLTLQNPSSYLPTVISAADLLLRFPPLSATLSAFKVFFSSLSPLRTAAVLPRLLSTGSLSFSHPLDTLHSLSTTLNSISTSIDLPNSPRCARASYAASSLLQLIHDYAWETEKDNPSGEDDFIDGGFMEIPSNLVILLSPIGQSVNCSVNYLESCEFDEVFLPVREAFATRDIHLCWVDVRSDELEIAEIDEKKNECGDNLVMMRDGIRKLGWGFCSSDFIILGSSLLPLGLIFPKIGVSFDSVDFGKRKYGELDLEILGVNGMPLECKFCDLEFANVRSFSCNVETGNIINASQSRDSWSLCSQNALWMRIGEGKLKLHVKSVHRYDECNKAGSSSIILVRERLQELQKNKQKCDYDTFANKVLEMLHEEMGGLSYRNQLPTWQMFLSFLHMKGYWATVSISSSNGDTFTGSLKPFTANLAILYILDAGPVTDLIHFNSEKMNGSNRCSGSQTNTSTSGYCEQNGDGKRKRIQKHLYKEMTWSSFRKAAFEGYNFDLFELYFARSLENCKKLKFLKCWMKQISRVDECNLATLLESKSVDESPGCNALLPEPSSAEEGVMPVSLSDNSETFLSNLSKRIDHGLESGMDLQKLAEQVVKSSVHWLHHKREKETNSEGQESVKTSDDDKLIKLLLRSPKEMKKTHQGPSPSSSSEYIVREYELQVLLRMEILRSDVSAMMRESRKQKLRKQICSLLEIIQYLVAGGIHGHISLYDYVERTIRTRYWNELEDVVKKLYSEMDLLPFGEEEEEAPSLVFNSEDSNQSWREKHDRNDKGEGSRSVSTEGDSSQPNAWNWPVEAGKEDVYSRSLNEARQRRERARNFAPFISKARDLQRVWAPKTKTKSKSDHVPNKSKRKHKETPYSVVCETPMTRNKRASLSDDDHGNPSSSVSKALFQDNDDYSHQ